MNIQYRIQKLQNRRRELLELRSKDKCQSATIDLELIRIRSELLAIYKAVYSKPVDQLVSGSK